MLVRRQGLALELPFLDRDLVELALGLPNSIAQASGWNKGILRRVSELMLPASIAWRTTRTRFDSLFSMERLAGVLPPSAESWRLVQSSIVDPAGLDKLLEGCHIEWESRGTVVRLCCVELFLKSKTIKASGCSAA